MANTPLRPHPPPPPQVVLRVAVAGSRELGPSEATVSEALHDLWLGLAGSLPAEGARLVAHSALADGVDRLAAESLLANPVPGVTCEHVALLPFSLDDYRASGTIGEPAQFEDLLARSSGVIEADGRWLPADPDDPIRDAFARHARGRGYRAQARLMLQRCDVLVAVFDPSASGRAGGTAETVRAALDIGLPVLVFGLKPLVGASGWRLLQSVAELEAWRSWPDAISECDLRDAKSTERLQSWVRRGELPEAQPGWQRLQWIWPWFYRFYTPVGGKLAHQANSPEGPAGSLDELLGWASNTNTELSQSYRGGFVATYGLAALAATVAAASLGIMASAAILDPEVNYSAVKWLLLMAGFCKLAMILLIIIIVFRNEHRQWNRGALASRYLAEHLRVLRWLPALGLLRIPSPRGHHHAGAESEFRRVAERLAATLRAAPPETGLLRLPGSDPPRWRVDPLAAIKKLRAEWVRGQQDYHARNARVMASMANRLKHRAEGLSKVVIVAVIMDVILIGLALYGVAPANGETASVAKVWLVVLAAALPAWIAALNGLREQAEAPRLADRSEQLAKDLTRLGERCDELAGRIEGLQGRNDDPGAWTLEALALAEQCSVLVSEDVAEWGVLYGKELLES